MTTVNVTIAGQEIQCFGFLISSGSYGSVGHGTLRTSRSWLDANKIDLFTIAASAPSPVPVAIYMDDVLCFGGELVDTTWEYDQDEVEVHFRDWAGLLVDQKRILTDVVAGVNAVAEPLTPGQKATLNVPIQNQTLENIITPIAQAYGFTPVFNWDGGASNGMYGAQDQPNSTLFTSIPQSCWAILNQLARETGYEVYVTPDQRLVFGTPGYGLPTLALSYNVSGIAGSSSVPCRALRVRHNPRRNSTFRVLVLSYDNLAAQTVIGRTTVIGTGFTGINQQLRDAGVQQNPLQQGVYNGPDAIAADSEFLGKSENTPSAQVQLYTFHIDGLTQSQAQTRATGIAIDIMRREIIVEAEIDGYPTLRPTQRFTVRGQIEPTVMGRVYYAQAFEHKFVLPRGRGMGRDEGFVTNLRGLSYPGGEE